MSRDSPGHGQPARGTGPAIQPAGAQPAPTTRPLGPRYDRRGAREGALGRHAAR